VPKLPRKAPATEPASGLDAGFFNLIDKKSFVTKKLLIFVNKANKRLPLVHYTNQ